MSPAVLPPIAVIAQRNRIIRHFNQAAAHSPESARSLDDLGLTRGLIIRRMIKRGVLREEPGGRLWLDQAANDAFRRRALQRIAVVFGVVAVVVAIVLLTR